jgi:hypothetical protein
VIGATGRIGSEIVRGVPPGGTEFVIQAWLLARRRRLTTTLPAPA